MDFIERRQLIVEMKGAGFRKSELGRLFGISGERVRQILIPTSIKHINCRVCGKDFVRKNATKICPSCPKPLRIRIYKRKVFFCIFCKSEKVGPFPACEECMSVAGSMKSYRPEGKDRVRFLARVRDKFTCQDCGLVRTLEMVKESNKGLKSLKGRIKSLDVHHLNGLCGKKSLAYESDEALKNLITLCHKCHYNRPEHRVKSKDFMGGRPKSA